MIVDIVTSKIEQGLFDELNKRLSKVDQSDLEHNHIVLVPPRFSMTTESQIINSLNSRGSFNIRVSSFEGIANELEESTLPYLGQEGAVMILTKILFDHKDELVYFRRSLNVPGFASEMYTTIGKLKLSRISPDDLISASEKVDKFRSKNKEIGLIYKWYEDYLKGNFLDSITRLNNLANTIETDETIKETSFYILGYQDFTEQDYILIEKLIKNAKSVFIGVLSNMDPNYVHIYNNEQYRRIIEIVKKCKASYTVNEADKKLNKTRTKLLETIFTTNKITKTKIKDEIKVFEATSMMDECIYAAKNIKKIVEEGDRYKDVQIVCLNDDYIPYLESTCQLYDIPIYIDKRYVLSNHPLCIYLNELIDLKRYGLKQSDALSFIKNYFFNEKDYFDFELFVLKRNINRTRFFEEFKGLKNEDVSKNESIRKKFEKLVRPIIDLPDKAKAIVYLNALKDFIKFANIEDRLRELTNDLGEKSTLGKVNTQIFRKINKLIDIAEKILSDIEITFSEFAAIFLNGIAVDSASIIPLYLDSVFVGTDRNEYSESKYVVFIGCDSASFPSISQDTGIINDDNIYALKQCGITFTPSNESKNRSSFINAHQLLLKATKKVIFTFNNLEGRRQSIVIDDLARAFVNSGEEFVFDKQDSIDTYTNLALKSEYYKHLGMLGRNQEQENELATLETLMSSKDDQDALHNVEIKKALSIVPEKTSVSEIESFYTCPYMRFVRYNLHAQEVDKGEIDAKIWGKITHEVLERFIGMINETEGQDVTKIASNIFEEVANSEKYAYFTSDTRNKSFLIILKKRTIESCGKVLASLEDSLFKAIKEELWFSGSKEDNGFVIKGKKSKVQLTGAIDRVDIYKDNVRVIDYKSGSKSSASFDIKKVNNGTKLQLPIYLKTISDILDKEPSGAFYMILNDAYTKENSKEEAPNYKLEGFFINDLDIVNAMDTTYAKGKSEHLYGVKDEDGEIKGNKNNVVLDKDKFDKLIEDSYQKAIDAVIAMEENNIELKPVDENDTCKFCSYKNICMKNIVEEE